LQGGVRKAVPAAFGRAWPFFAAAAHMLRQFFGCITKALFACGALHRKIRKNYQKKLTIGFVSHTIAQTVGKVI
jgi:hypothetical protein